MEDDKANLARLGNTLASEMNKITQNFRLGFGSFVDKKTMPYVSTVPEKLASPCTGCAAPYGFHHKLRLTDDTSRFESEVISAPISGNLDSPEGGFDAIMQAISCKNEIGWRNQSRKMLLFSTDAGFHYAGDGKLGGIVTPNDGQCHLDSDGFYKESLNQDYPSISQLSHHIAEKKVNVIFAVTQNQLPVYTKLSDFIEGSTFGELAQDSANIVELVKENYRKISSSIEMKTEADEDLSVVFKSRCLGTEILEGTGSIRCDGLGIAQNVSIDVYVESTTCPADPREWKKQFRIYPVGLAEKLVVNVEMECECECEKPQYEEKHSRKCNNSGTYECGACTCDPGRYGIHCECDGTTLGSAEYDASCKRTNSSLPCEGRGTCYCGNCVCNPIGTTGDQSRRFSGSYCECNDYSCDWVDEELCGGPSRGRCKCGKCECLPFWDGPSCSCSTRNDTCITKNNQNKLTICNDEGSCVCGKCQCYSYSLYLGPTCQDCPTCKEECIQKQPCVQCAALNQFSKLNKKQCETLCPHVIIDKELGHHEVPDEWRQCLFRDDENCDVSFEYNYNNHTVIYVKEEKDCPKPVNILAIILGVIIGIILIGLALLLIWKLLVTIHDRREFARFEKELENARWDMGENPIYKQATTSYKNPTYANNR